MVVDLVGRAAEFPEPFLSRPVFRHGTRAPLPHSNVPSGRRDHTWCRSRSVSQANLRSRIGGTTYTEEDLPIGTIAERAGVSVSALRFYEAKGLIASRRSEGGQRRYRRSVLRRVAFIQVAQRVGLSLDEIGQALATLPGDDGLTADDWRRLSAAWRPFLDERIRLLEGLRDELDSCIGCGCLSLDRCRLRNPGDRAAGLGAGPRYLLDDDGHR